MVFYFVEVEKGEEVNSFFSETREKLEGVELLTNPFTNSKIDEVTNNIWLIKFTPVYPKIYYWGLIWSALVIVFGWSHYLHLITGLFALQILVYSNRFYYFMNVLGLRKAGYKGRVKMLTYKTVIERLLENGSN